VVVPPALFGSIVAGAAALGLLGSVLPAQVALRGRPSAAPDRVA
jgi:hypothetical protein